ncbi:hypothetical protein G5T42_01565 [Microbacterium sp. 4R-513]|uniref:hypothetical protein n=1 Tax=Microbacterium sp. 4R-513 TaxID=2567934 RepID=UPI0013E124AA|nr:hypothetical protein [Microbacterium sp. 4R-513]QIG38324.1 hypothetical protein G5T42_01565 [Microbacterium sp. 4R-513]
MTAAPPTAPRRARSVIVITTVLSILLAGLLGMPAAVSTLSAAEAAAGGPVKTADLSKFQAGNIISDAVFFNKGTMSEGQIQSFLESKVPTCQAGYTCLKDWYDTSRSTNADAMCAPYSGGFRERASAIIYKVAQACGINPQVILATLQKEQGLVLHTWPSTWRYTIAMGQGCPDTAACDTRYYGFFNQVYGAAWQFKRYANPPGTSNYFNWYAPGRTWNVLYSPNAACGSSPVLIQNQATANLYYYTPYQPNAASLRAGYGTGDGCSTYGNRNFYNYFTDWFGSTQSFNNPFGNIELIQALPGQFRVAGWAADLDTTSPISIHVYAGSQSTAFTADLDRSDIAAAYPAVGSRHGFDVKVPAVGAGTTSVCVYAINVGGGGNVLLGCSPVAAMSGAPVGAFDTVQVADGTVQVSGWAIDPDTTGPTSVHVYVDSVGTPVTADRPRAELAPTYPAYGTNHGFTATLPAAAGTRSVCAYAINVGPGGTTVLGCQTVTVGGPIDLGRVPFGAFEGLDISGNTASASGWAIDPDTTAPIKVHLYVGSTGAEYTADKPRADVAAAYPGTGTNHGFAEKLTLPVGTTQVCAYAINNGAGGPAFLGCKSATVAGTTPDLGRAPFGNLEAVTVSGNAATASGWAIDPDTTAPIKVHLYVGSVSAEYTADKARSDVAAAYPASGPNHGFVEKLTLPAGTTQVCAYAINSGPGGNAFLGCKTVTVASTAPDLGRAPIGNLEGVVAGAGGANVSGWALDPDTTASINVHIYVGSTGAQYLADKSRPDVGAVYRLGDAHGFAEFIPMTSGTKSVCVYAINSGAGGHAFLGCRDVVIP